MSSLLSILSKFLTISSDNDFSCIINLLKRYNKTVYGIGSKNANLYLQNVCHKFTKIGVFYQELDSVNTELKEMAEHNTVITNPIEL